MRYFKKGTTKVEIIDKILTLYPSLEKLQAQLFALSIKELEDYYEKIKKGVLEPWVLTH